MKQKYVPTGRVLEALFNELQDAVFVMEGGSFSYVNQRVMDILGCRPEDILGQPFITFVHPKDQERLLAHYAARLKGEEAPSAYSFQVVTQSGEVRDLYMQISLLDDVPDNSTVVGSVQDVTESRQTAIALAHSQAEVNAILNNLPDVFYRVDMDGKIQLISPSCEEAMGYTPTEMAGQFLADFYWEPRDREAVVQAITKGGGRATHVEARLKHKDGSPVWVSTNAYIRFDDDDRPLYIEGIARNISERKALEDQLEALARTDDLTRLLNRRTFLEESRRLIDLAKRHNRPLTLLMLDLDHFKRINDDHGHETGDKALRHFAQTCRDAFRSSDLVARMGGEEFAILLPDTPPQDAMVIIERLRQTSQATPMELASGALPLTFSAGVTNLSPEDRGPNDMLRRADSLMYDAKRAGRNRITVGKT